MGDILTSTGRMDLTKAIPFPSPLSLFIEPTNVCNFKCDFCPESLPDYKQQAGYYGHMKAALWTKIVKDIDSLPTRLRLARFWMLGEPLLCPSLPGMITELGALGAARRELFTNGTLLGTRAAELMRAGISKVRISVYDVESETYREILHQATEFRRLRGYRISPEIEARLVMRSPTREQRARFCRDFDDLAEIRSFEPDLHNWGGDLVQIGNARTGTRQVCPWPFYQLAIHADGRVSACCVDWRSQLVVGDLNSQSLMEIWQGEPLRKIQDAHRRGARRELEACRECTAFYDHVDNMDSLLEPRS